MNVRRAETTVEMGDGESIVIAGLFRNAWNEVESGVPFLKDLPLLGRAFGHTSTRSAELELIVTVTARLTQAAQVPDFSNEPQHACRTTPERPPVTIPPVPRPFGNCLMVSSLAQTNSLEALPINRSGSLCNRFLLQLQVVVSSPARRRIRHAFNVPNPSLPVVMNAEHASLRRRRNQARHLGLTPQLPLVRRPAACADPYLNWYSVEHQHSTVVKTPQRFLQSSYALRQISTFIASKVADGGIYFQPAFGPFPV